MRLTRLLQSWREASTVMLCARSKVPPPRPNAGNGNASTGSSSRPRPSGNAPAPADVSSFKFDYKVLMLERSGKSTFFPSAYVFPGGAVSSSDHSEGWLRVFSEGGVTDVQNTVYSNNSSVNRSPMFTKARDWALPSELAFRICAIRETFEEAGLLLCKSYTDASMDNADTALSELLKNAKELNKWRHIIRKDASQFLVMCQEFSIIPNVWRLHEWSNWLTPTNMEELHGGRRYDTAFYICNLKSQPKSVVDDHEIVASNWHEPQELLEEFYSEKHWLAPPQVYELQRICNFQELENLKKFAEEREKQGCERWMPVRNQFSDGIAAALPGDELYPESPDFEGKLPAAEWQSTLEESLNSSKSIHRLELRGTFDSRIHSRVAQPMGHAEPYPLSKILRK